MDSMITPEQINQIVRAARVLAPGFSQENLEHLIECQKHLEESGFCEAVWAVARLQEERNTGITEVLDDCERLLKEHAELTGKLDELKRLSQTQQEMIQDTEQRHQQVIQATEQAGKELSRIKAEKEREERKLAACCKKAQKEKRRIDRELEACRRQAGVSREETQTAGELKKSVEESGFNLEQMLSMCREFAGFPDAKDRLKEALKKDKEITAYIKDYRQWALNTKDALEKEHSTIKSNIN